MRNKLKQRVVKWYLAYCLAVIVGVTCSMLLVFYWSTVSGDYTQLLPTNSYGEHWIEVFVLLSSFPGIISIVLNNVRWLRGEVPS